MSGLDRDTIDKFYTKKDFANMIVAEVAEELGFRYYEYNIIEPSAGSGSFLTPLKAYMKYGSNLTAYDIEPEGEGIIKADYLKTEPPLNKDLQTLVIGNPPFGRQSSLAKKFIKHSVKFADYIGFILPLSFKKPTYQKAFPIEWTILKEIGLPLKSFTLYGEDYSVPCVFQLWTKLAGPRVVVSSQIPSWLQKVSKAEGYDFAIRRIGWNTGIIQLPSNDLSESSNYFFKLDQDHISIQELFDDYNPTFHNYTVGARCVSLPEIYTYLRNRFDEYYL